MTNCFCTYLSVIFVFISSGNKHKNNPLMSTETVRHSSTYIILYLCRMNRWRMYRHQCNFYSSHSTLWQKISMVQFVHYDVIKWKHFPRYWPFVRGIHRPLVSSPHKGQWCRALMFPLICAWIKRLSKQSWDWWFETPSCSLWRHGYEGIKKYVSSISTHCGLVSAQCINA